MNNIRRIRWYHLYFFGVRLGFSCLRAGNINLGLRSMCNPIRTGYGRYLEVPYAINAMQLKNSDRVLDIASPKHVALFIRRASFSCHVTSIDIEPDFIKPYTIYERNLRLNDISWEMQDARHLSYPDASFDKIYSISVLEHIPDNGDSLAMQEIGRLLKPGGICVITVPFCSTFKELYKDMDVYERKFTGKPVLFSRSYDDQSLSTRLIVPSNLQEIDRRYYVARLGFLETCYNKFPQHFQMLLHWAGPIFSYIFYKKTESLKQKGVEGFCCITLKKGKDNFIGKTEIENLKVFESSE